MPKLSPDYLITFIRNSFKSIPEHRSDNYSISLVDALVSAFAMFALKSDSLLEFQSFIGDLDKNLKNVYHIDTVPSDTHMRRILDSVDPSDIRKIFPLFFRLIQRTKRHEVFSFMNDYYLISIDGTGYFSSKTIHCKNCMQKTSKGGVVEYYHQFLGASIVHPDLKTVIPLCPEPIEIQDGSTKNDCERNASKRFLVISKKTIQN